MKKKIIAKKTKKDASTSKFNFHSRSKPDNFTKETVVLINEEAVRIEDVNMASDEEVKSIEHSPNIT